MRAQVPGLVICVGPHHRPPLARSSGEVVRCYGLFPAHLWHHMLQSLNSHDQLDASAGWRIIQVDDARTHFPVNQEVFPRFAARTARNGESGIARLIEWEHCITPSRAIANPGLRKTKTLGAGTQIVGGGDVTVCAWFYRASPAAFR